MLTCEIEYKDGSKAGFMVDKGVIVHHQHKWLIGWDFDEYRRFREGDKITILEDDEDAD